MEMSPPSCVLVALTSSSRGFHPLPPGRSYWRVGCLMGWKPSHSVTVVCGCYLLAWRTADRGKRGLSWGRQAGCKPASVLSGRDYSVTSTSLNVASGSRSQALAALTLPSLGSRPGVVVFCMVHVCVRNGFLLPLSSFVVLARTRPYTSDTYSLTGSDHP